MYVCSEVVVVVVVVVGWLGLGLGFVLALWSCV